MSDGISHQISTDALEMSSIFYCRGILYISGKSPEVFTIIQETVVAE